MLNAVLVGAHNRRLTKIEFKQLDSEFFHRDSLIMAKCFIFLCIFCDLGRVETGVSEEGINSLKALPKSSKLLWRVKTLIIN